MTTHSNNFEDDKTFPTTLIALDNLAGFNTSDKKEKPLLEVVNESLGFAAKQSLRMAESLKYQPDRLPKTIDKERKLITCKSDWSADFFRGNFGICTKTRQSTA